MVLVVIADIEVEIVCNAIVAVGLLPRDELIVLSDEVTCRRVQSQTQKGASQQVAEGLGAQIVEDSGVETHLYNPVETLPEAEWLRFDQHGTETIAQGLRHDPQNLSHGVRNPVEFNGMWNVSVDSINTLVLVMIHVIWFECLATWNAGSEICHDGCESISSVLMRARPA